LPIDLKQSLTAKRLVALKHFLCFEQTLISYQQGLWEKFYQGYEERIRVSWGPRQNLCSLFV